MATMRSTPPRRPSQPCSETRTSYHVGRPWMFEGKMLRGLTGMPMRMIDLAKSVFAEADPDPFTLANLTTKSLTACSGFMRRGPRRARGRSGPVYPAAQGRGRGLLRFRNNLEDLDLGPGVPAVLRDDRRVAGPFLHLVELPGVRLDHLAGPG